MAGQHEVIAENTQSQLISSIQKSVTEFKNDRKKVKFSAWSKRKGRIQCLAYTMYNVAKKDEI